MPIPDERFPLDESDEDSVEQNERSEMLDENDELEFESSDADTADDVILDDDDAGEPSDTAGFGYGDPAE
jgi:hypothetical protein